MGKYKTFSDEMQYHNVYKAIANELAEANRLKTIEIRLTCATNSGISREHNILILKEIEDKA